VVKVRRGDPARAAKLLTLGDRMFRIDDWKRAEDRYEQAARLDPEAAAPRVRLAQVAIVRERYREAADRLREAETAEPGWIATARDVEALYAEPADFAKGIARLQSHLHAHPGDRDAWLVLGAQWFLSGRERQAADVFRRLDDPHRRPDAVLAGFLDATNQPRAAEPVPEPAGAGGDPFKPPANEP
jgi:tetratricopeptide (TPR) repeat protein